MNSSRSKIKQKHQMKMMKMIHLVIVIKLAMEAMESMMMADSFVINSNIHPIKRIDLTTTSTSAPTPTVTKLFMAKSTAHLLTKQWLPSIDVSDDDIFASDERRENLERDSILFLDSIIRERLRILKGNDNDNNHNNHVEGRDNDNDDVNSDDDDVNSDDDDVNCDDDKNSNKEDPAIEIPSSTIIQTVNGKFHDLTCTIQGEEILQNLLINNDYHTNPPPNNNIDIIRGSITALQSLLIMGMQVGVKGNQEHQQRLVSHLASASSKSSSGSTSSETSRMEAYFNKVTIKKLKHQVDVTAGTQLLSSLKRKRTAQSAYDLLVQLGIWEKHEDVALLRSGFPLRFRDDELEAGIKAETHGEWNNENNNNIHDNMDNNDNDNSNVKIDPDNILGLRKDLRSMKVYTIDGEYAHEIDDGLSIEKVQKEDGSQRYRIWIHIADADKWAPRDSEIFQVAERRATSVYTPPGSISMFPSNLSTGAMSLRPDRDSYALSLGVELNDDGSIDEKTLQVTPSIIKVDYRLSYDEVDEMLDMGVGYFEEWELGALLSEANKRRKFRIANGSTEGFVPNPIPQAEIRTEPNADAYDGIDIIVKVEGTHNAGYNQSSTILDTNPASTDDYAPPISSSFLLVTEMMIMSGEAMGKFKAVAQSIMDNNNNNNKLENELDLPFRTQAKPDLSARYQELNNLESLKDRGYCHAWYARRFFEPVKVMSELRPHYGLGLDCYVQWSSPIRRFGDLQVHAAVKRFLRKEKLNQLMRDGKPIPNGLSDSDLGCIVPKPIEDSIDENGKFTEYATDFKNSRKTAELAINYKRGLGFIKAARVVQRKSNEYWLFELIRRRVESSDNDVEFEATVLACVDPNRFQYAIYVNELGLEHRYLSEKGYLQTGSKLLFKVDSVSPRHGLLKFTLSSKYSGRKKTAAAA